MKVSRKWLQKFFDVELPDTDALAEALTFHAFEIEEHDEDMLDVKVLPDRAAYALSHRGIALELSAILSLPLVHDPLQEPLPHVTNDGSLSLTLSSPLVNRHVGAYVRGVSVGPSPAWLTDAIESVGGRSINNIVDATNYVTFNMGQPVHAFDAKTLKENDVVSIGIRGAKENERVVDLTGKEHVLPKGTLVVCKGRDGEALDVAGVKGGKDTGTMEKTTELFITVANFDGTAIRKTAQALKLWTDASLRFQNKPSAELPAYGMRDVLALILEVAGGEVVAVEDLYPNKETAPRSVSASLSFINGKLGSSFTGEEIESVFKRLLLSYEKDGEEYRITPRFERKDIVIPEDIVEEVGRILGYDRIAPAFLPVEKEADQAKWRGIEHIKDLLISRGFTEVSTPSFSKAGDVLLSNPLDEERPYLRATLTDNLREALRSATHNAPRVWGPVGEVRLFELGTVFTKEGERLSLAVGASGKKITPIAIEGLGTVLDTSLSDGYSVTEILLGDERLNQFSEGAVARHALQAYKPFSLYPFALRDVAVWTPDGTKEETVRTIIEKEAGELLARLDCFDTFSKEGRVSYAFRLVLEAEDRTLSEEELASLMGKVSDALSATGYEVR